MKIDWATEFFCLIGNPTKGSLSPFIHNNIFDLKERNYKYLNFNIEEDQLEDSLKGLSSLGFKGFNVTIPYKKKIISYLDEISPESKSLGAINTVKIKDNKLIGHNTDGLGFIKTLSDANIPLKGKNILMIGAGGASYSIANSLLDQAINSLTILNRSLSNAEALKDKLKERSKIDIRVYGLDENIDSKNKYHILINTSSLGMEGFPDESPIDLTGFPSDLIVYDIIYKPLKTKLLLQAEELGLKNFNGLSMLVNQAILAQEFWFDKGLSRDEEEVIKEKLYKYLESGKNHEPN